MPPDPILGLKINGKKYEHVITFSGSPKIGKNLWERNPETKRKATFYHSWQRAIQLYNSLLGFGCEFGGGWCFSLSFPTWQCDKEERKRQGKWLMANMSQTHLLEMQKTFWSRWS